MKVMRNRCAELKKISWRGVERLILGFLIFLALYQPTIVRLRATAYIPIIGLVLFVVFRLNCINIWNTDEGKLIKSLVGMEIYLLLSLMISKGDFSILKKPIHIFFAAIYVYGTVSYMIRFHITKEDLRNVILNVGLFQSIVCIIMCICVPLRKLHWNYLLSTIVDPEQKEYFESILTFRYYGIAGITQYLSSIGIVSAILFLLALFWAVKLHSRIFFVKSLFLLLPAILDTRMGVVCAAIGTIVLLLHFLMNDVSRNRRIVLKTGIGVIVCMLLSYKLMGNEFFHLFSIAENSATYEQVKAASEWSSQAAQAVTSLARNDTTSPAYVWYGGLLPWNWAVPRGLQFLIGQGSITLNNVYWTDNIMGRTEPGYVRLICVGGIVLLLIQLFILFYVIGLADKSKEERTLLWALVCCFLVAEFKTNVYLQTPVIISILLILHSFLNNEK